MSSSIVFNNFSYKKWCSKSGVRQIWSNFVGQGVHAYEVKMFSDYKIFPAQFELKPNIPRTNFIFERETNSSMFLIPFLIEHDIFDNSE
ncbi:LOW QUALITY PROTEIN: hypothetical protein HZS_6662 [Henneguya salminicola]|nr:LOW QUALITY PROTEIN: hypothetical protein HZS_6662 [Henneguya salminicola]